MAALVAEADQDPTPGEDLDPGHVQHAGQDHAQGLVHDPGEVQEAGLAQEAGEIQDPGADPLPEDQDPNLQHDQGLEARKRDLGQEVPRKREAKAEAGRGLLPKKTEIHHQSRANRKKAKKKPCPEAHLPGSNLQEYFLCKFRCFL